MNHNEEGVRLTASQRKLVVDIEGLLVGLTGFIFRAKRGNDELSMGFTYGRKKLETSVSALQAIGMYESVREAMSKSEALARSGSFDEGAQVLLDMSGLLMEASGTADHMRRYTRKLKREEKSHN